MSNLPPRRLPWEVLLLIVKEADPSTLAVLGRVSYDFLAATAPDLYRSVTVESLDSLKKLFCQREVKPEEGRRTRSSPPASRINLLLSLSQIQTLSITLDSFPMTTRLSPSRLVEATSIPLATLHLSLPHSIRGKVDSLDRHLLPLLNPVRCHWNILRRPFKGTRWVTIGRSSLAGWTRLEQVDLKGGLPWSEPREGLRLAALPPPSLARRRVVRLHVASLFCLASPDLRCALDDIAGRDILYGLDTMQAGSLVLVVGSEEEKRETEEVVRTFGEIEPWRRVFAVAVEVEL
ncbi:hypothetical protein BDY24DRAFT_417171 [Mrakia frigida]|uniref:uncharacterized protein n=1 Tax=Mrakia frigida TaxID=29902 RepID=UPI003FCC0351